jgi:methyl-accepting chemotaxis protein
MVRLTNKIMLPILAGGIALGGVTLVVLYLTKQANVRASGLKTAESVANQVAAVRTFYTAQVVSRAAKAGMNVNYDFDQVEDTLPLPATFVHSLGREIAESYPGMRIRLYSKYPFPHRKPTEQYDDFESLAIAALEQDPKTPVSRLEPVDGRLSMRYAVADQLRPACVNCHNTHPESPKTDWKVGDVRGAVEVIVPVDDIEQQMRQSMIRVGGVVVATFAILVVVTFLITRRSVVRPLTSVTAMADRLAAGDLRNPRIDAPSRDEVGEMAQSLSGALQSMSQMIAQVDQNAQSLATSSEELMAVNQQVRSHAETTSASVSGVERASEQVNKNVQIVAEAVEVMNRNINKISQNAAEAARVAGLAVRITDSTNASVSKLSDSSAQIGSVVKIISSIAEQTNLLALNATIEAARAGEAGKGFAVVANEVKELARQTAKATEDIGRRIKVIQDDSTGAVTSIQRINKVIAQINEISNSIATAVGEHTATTESISQNLTQAANKTSEIAGSMNSVAQLSRETIQGAGGTQDAAAELARMATKLKQMVSRFKYDAPSG